MKRGGTTWLDLGHCKQLLFQADIRQVISQADSWLRAGQRRCLAFPHEIQLNFEYNSASMTFFSNGTVDTAARASVVLYCGALWSQRAAELSMGPVKWFRV